MSLTTKDKIRALLSKLSTVEKTAILYSLGKEYRKDARAEMQDKLSKFGTQLGRYGRRVDERPDEANLKGK